MAPRPRKPNALQDLPAQDSGEIRGGSMDGINALANVSQIKADNANTAAATPPKRRI